MRLIKFRGKRIDNDQWIYGSLVVNEDGDTSIISSDKSQWGVISETVGQYIGLKDKNSKEIYEGDIVAFDNGDYVVGRGVVIWDDEQAGFLHTWLEYAGDECLQTWRPRKRLWVSTDPKINFEVIGNVHNNPELLTQTKETE